MNQNIPDNQEEFLLNVNKTEKEAAPRYYFDGYLDEEEEDENDSEENLNIIIEDLTRDIPHNNKKSHLLNHLSPRDSIHSDVYSSPEEYTSSHLLSDPIYFNKQKDLEILQTYDIVITHSWDGKHYGPISAWYDAFELWYMVQYNTLPQDLGGLRVALLFPDCPTHQDRIKLLEAIFNKYNINRKMYTYLCQHIYFINQPKELLLSKGNPPYKNYNPTNIVFIDGNLPSVMVRADNIYLSLIGSLKEENLIYTDYNYLMIYFDKRIMAINEEYQKEGLGKNIKITRSQYPNTLIFDDIRRIDFSIFKRTIKVEDNVREARDIRETREVRETKKRFLMYLTPKNRTPKWIKNDTQTIKEIDDILNAIPDTYINKTGLTVRNNQKELYNYYKNLNKNEKIKGFDKDQIEAIRNKGEIFGNGFTIENVIEEDPKAHLILVGLDSVTQEFESLLLARAFKRGINISTEVYLQKDLPISNIHDKYDIYLFTPAFKWTTSRFIPEALYHNKKIIYTKMATKSMQWNFPLLIRVMDSKNYLSYLTEDDAFKKPKSKLAQHLLGQW